jgi:hypothetical protein
MRLAITCCLMAFLLHPVFAQKRTKKANTVTEKIGNVLVLVPDSLAWQIGGSGADIAIQIAMDSEGNILLAGLFGDTLLVGSTRMITKKWPGAFIVRYSPTGVIQWARQLGGPRSTQVNSMAVDADDQVYITGMFEKQVDSTGTPLNTDQDIFLSKYNKQGDLVWTRELGGRYSDVAEKVLVDNQKNVYLSGHLGEKSSDQDSFQDTKSSAILVKFDASGNQEWLRKIEGKGDSFGSNMASDPWGNVYLCGILIDSVQIGNIRLSSGGSMDLDSYLAKCSPDGVFQWAIRMGGKFMDDFGSMMTDEKGNVYITGMFTTDEATFGDRKIVPKNQQQNARPHEEGFLAKLNTNGELQWIEQEPIANVIWGRSLARDASGDIYMVSNLPVKGAFDNRAREPNGEGDMILARYNSEGKRQWVRQVSAPGGEEATGIVMGPDGALWVAGTFKGKTNLAGQTLTSKGGHDVFVLKYPHK